MKKLWCLFIALALNVAFVHGQASQPSHPPKPVSSDLPTMGDASKMQFEHAWTPHLNTVREQDCTITATVTYNRLKSAGAWSEIIAFDLYFPDGRKLHHAACIFKPSANSNVRLYEAHVGAVNLYTKSTELREIERAYNNAINQRWHADRFEVLEPEPGNLKAKSAPLVPSDLPTSPRHLNEREEDCMITATVTYNRLKSAGAWSEIIAYHLHFPDGRESYHAECIFKPSANSNVRLYTKYLGALKLDTKSTELREIERAYNNRMNRRWHADRFEVVEPESAPLTARAATGDSNSEYRLGLCYYNGDGVAKDFSEAVKWFRKAAEQNLAQAQFALGNSYFKGQGVTKDEVEAVKWYRKAAEQNVAETQYNLGLCYAKGQGVTKDEVEAGKWFRKAADQNHAPAQFDLGNWYANGQGVTKNYAEAVKWFRKAADQNLAPAQITLGYCYAKGQGVTKDEVEAVKWFRKAAEQNYAPAQFNLGYCYAEGQGVTKDEGEALKWYRKAAEQNVAEAQFNLGICYYTSQGVARDYAEAVKWYRKAAEQNHAQAQFNLGVAYGNGQGVAKDEVEGYKWFLLAGGQGEENAKKNVAVAESRLTREQIAEGQRLARNFKPREVPSEGSDSSGAAKTRPSLR